MCLICERIEMIKNNQNKFFVKELERPVRLEVFTNNERAKALYRKFGFERANTITEKWSDEFPVVFSQDTMELR